MTALRNHEAQITRDRAFVFSRDPSLLTSTEREHLRRIRRMTTDAHVAAKCDQLLAEEA